MPTIRLSDAAYELLCRRLAGEWVEVTEETRPLYRELVEAGMMPPCIPSPGERKAPTA